MFGVGIVFKDGKKVLFRAQEFDINLSTGATTTGTGSGSTSTQDPLRRFEYRDENGNRTPLYLQTSQVAGIIVAPENTKSGRSVDFPS